MTSRQRRVRVCVLAAVTLATTALHFAAPAGPHAWHGVHLLAQKLYYLPILLAAAWFTGRGTVVTTTAVSLLYLAHVIRDWRGHPMVQAEQAASVATFWLVGLTAASLFRRIRTALAEVGAAHEETLSALTSALELRERYTAGHSERVRAYTLLLAERLGIRDPETLAQLSAGALFHDVGKIGMPDAVLLKEGPLDASDWSILRTHPDLGAGLVGRVRSLSAARELVLSHHERVDGTGYPRGLRGGEIPLGARLFAVADAFDAMTTRRPYRPASSHEQARAALMEGSGSQFDPRVVDAFLGIPFETWAACAASSGVILRRTDAPGVPAPSRS